MMFPKIERALELGYQVNVNFVSNNHVQGGLYYACVKLGGRTLNALPMTTFAGSIVALNDHLTGETL